MKVKISVANPTEIPRLKKSRGGFFMSLVNVEEYIQSWIKNKYMTYIYIYHICDLYIYIYILGPKMVLKPRYLISVAVLRVATNWDQFFSAGGLVENKRVKLQRYATTTSQQWQRHKRKELRITPTIAKWRVKKIYNNDNTYDNHKESDPLSSNSIL